MPILNYTTKIEPLRTASEIQEILADAGASGVIIEFDKDKMPSTLIFQIEVNGQQVGFRLPSKWEGVYVLLRDDNKIKRIYRTPLQARRIAWRIIKDWVEAQLAIVQVNAADLAEVFLPYAVNPRTRLTLYEEFKSGNLLPSGDNGGPIESDYREVD